MEKEYVNCKECGAHEELHWVKATEDKLRERQLCFNCNHWFELTQVKDGIRIDGVHYMDGGRNNSNPRWNGFGGREFAILMNDGKRITTNNLWCQGTIALQWRNRLPDNAQWEK